MYLHLALPPGYKDKFTLIDTTNTGTFSSVAVTQIEPLGSGDVNILKIIIKVREVRRIADLMEIFVYKEDESRERGQNSSSFIEFFQPKLIFCDDIYLSISVINSPRTDSYGLD